MTESTFNHSERWLAILSTPMDELGSYERAGIGGHVHTCPICRLILADNALLERSIEALPGPDFPTGMSPRILQLWQEEDRNRKV